MNKLKAIILNRYPYHSCRRSYYFWSTLKYIPMPIKWKDNVEASAEICYWPLFDKRF